MSLPVYPDLVQINGYCADCYEPVKQLFVKNFRTGQENNAQLCIYVNNECVVDLYGTAIGDTSYTRDTIQVSNFPIIYFLILVLCFSIAQ